MRIKCQWKGEWVGGASAGIECFSYFWRCNWISLKFWIRFERLKGANLWASMLEMKQSLEENDARRLWREYASWTSTLGSDFQPHVFSSSISIPSPFDTLVLTSPSTVVPSSFSFMQKLHWPCMNLVLSLLPYLLSQDRCTQQHCRPSLQSERLSCHRRIPRKQPQPGAFCTTHSLGTPGTAPGAVRELSHFLLSTPVGETALLLPSSCRWGNWGSGALNLTKLHI